MMMWYHFCIYVAAGTFLGSQAWHKHSINSAVSCYTFIYNNFSGFKCHCQVTLHGSWMNEVSSAQKTEGKYGLFLLSTRASGQLQVCF